MNRATLRRPCRWLLLSASARMGDSRADWARAMLAEADMCESETARFRWAFGCWVASVRASCNADGWVYAAAVITAMAVMTGYEWAADESRVTVFILSLTAMMLGVLRPRLALLSGTAVGLVVSEIILFEAASGIRPAYEQQAQTYLHGLYWLILLLPAVSCSLLGGWIGSRLRAGRTGP